MNNNNELKTYNINYEELITSEKYNVKSFFDEVKKRISPEFRIELMISCVADYDGNFDEWLIDIEKKYNHLKLQ